MEDIIKPIEDQFREKELQKAQKKVTTARVFIYVLAGMLLLGTLTARNPILFLLATSIFIAPIIYSYKNPYIGMLIATIMTILGELVGAFGFLRAANDLLHALLFFGIQILVTFFMIRGTINAKKIRDWSA